MCLVQTDEVRVAERNKKVYKVVKRDHRDFHFLFRDKNGGILGLGEFYSGSEISSLFNVKAACFMRGYGYHCFSRLDTVKRYKKCLMREKSTSDIGLCIVTLSIPKGSKFRKGEIGNGIVGTGLIALAAEKLVGPIDVVEDN